MAKLAIIIIAYDDQPELLPFYDLQFHHRVQWLRENWREGLRGLEAQLYIVEYRIGSPIYAPEVIDVLQQDRPGVPRLLVTGHQLSPEARGLLVARGAADILGLPVERASLAQAIARRCGNAPAATTPAPAPPPAPPVVPPPTASVETSTGGLDPAPRRGTGPRLTHEAQPDQTSEAPAPSGPELRAHPRSDTYLPMVFSAMDLNQIMEIRDNARVTNISRGGFRFLTPRRFHIGKEVYFLIRGPGGTTMRGRFEVLRVTPKGDLKEVAGRIVELHRPE